jgi:hypothetical protein
MRSIDVDSTQEDIQKIAQKDEVLKAHLTIGLNNIMSTKYGRQYMLTLIKSCNVFSSCYTGDNRTFYSEGKRDVGLNIYRDLQKNCKDEFNLMIKEGMENGAVL